MKFFKTKTLTPFNPWGYARLQELKELRGQRMRAARRITTAEKEERLYKRERAREYRRAARARAIASGICPKCGITAPEEGYVNCEACRTKARPGSRRFYAKQKNLPEDQERSTKRLRPS